MKRTIAFFSLLFIFCISLISISNANEVKTSFESQIEQYNRNLNIKEKTRTKPRSLLPSIEGYIQNDLLVLSVNHPLQYEMIVTVYNERAEAIYEGTFIVSEPMDIPILLDIEEGQSYELEIQIGDILLGAEF